MKTSKLLVGLAFVGMTAAACSVKTKNTGSSGVGGDEVGDPPVTSTNDATVGVGPTSTTAATTSTATGGSACDDGTMGDSGSAECTSCVQCAAQSTCATESGNCSMGSECATFDDCRIACITTADANKNMKIDDGAETDVFYDCFGVDPMTGMPDAALTMSCAAMHAQGYADWDAWASCIYGDCPNNCGVGGGGGTPICDSGFASSNKVCADCLTTNCCAEFKACNADTNCKDCLLVQNQAKCDAGMKDEAADSCYANKCMVECK